VATDLDGTLVRTDGSVDARTSLALRRVEQSGALVVFVTGRPPRWMFPLAGLVGHTTVAICSNGALLYDMHSDEIVDAHLLEVATLRAVAGRLRAALPGVTFALEFGFDFACEPGYVHGWDIGLPDIRVGPCEEICDQPAAKLLARDDGTDPDALLVKATEVVGQLATVTLSAPIGLLEISAPGVSKASALAEFAEREGIAPDDVLAFGDMPNDLAVLSWAGRSVAVANAHPAVLAVADEVTASNDEYGVALVLERLFGPGSDQRYQRYWPVPDC
jgi:hydroxymethylpyrimidine pyrophosphatase-like HAD family hydrolase